MKGLQKEITHLLPCVCVCVCVCVYARLVAQLCPTLWDPVGCNPQAPLSMAFSKWEYRRGLPLPSPVLTQGLNPGRSPDCSQVLYRMSYREVFYLYLWLKGSTPILYVLPRDFLMVCYKNYTDQTISGEHNSKPQPIHLQKWPYLMNLNKTWPSPM